ncbi:hypothetical protein IscW_ISCW004785 [Ixodes scapularis]|uniref:Uncharacterized protein n=1 Tax=Ixodes scapularis TaxID=6945 RepID=B7PIQ7_IXOSC|nr:hypothetical protein IscW_ISCW004785 [Ixodes scapularis]|eukprot:XP_002405838.1 hypothetical protein IscW_ISCW004785 [Ixodes scapularis]
MALATGHSIRTYFSLHKGTAYPAMTAVTAILFVGMFTSTLSAISDIVYLCAQCTVR